MFSKYINIMMLLPLKLPKLIYTKVSNRQQSSPAICTVPWRSIHTPPMVVDEYIFMSSSIFITVKKPVPL